MTKPDTPKPQTTHETDGDEKEQSVGGPTAPALPDDEKPEGPKTGGYDDHSPDRAPHNEKGGYGAG